MIRNRHKLSDRLADVVNVLAAVLIIGIVGTVLMLTSHAGTQTVSSQTETGKVTTAVKVTDSSAANGQAVKFGTTSAGGGGSSTQPNDTNTGVPAGTNLTVINGNVTVTKDGTVIDGEDIKGFLTIDANNVTVENSKIEGAATSATTAGLNIDSGTGTVLSYDTIAMAHPSVDLDSLWAQDFTGDHLNVSGGVDGMKLGSNSTLTSSYVHDLTYFTSDPNQGGGPTHNDTIQILSGTNINIKNNYLLATTDDNSAIQITQDFGTVANVLIQNNWANGGGCTFNLAWKGGGAITTISVIGNQIGHESYYDCPILLGTKVTLAQNTGNVWLDAPNTGLTVPVQQHD